MAISALSSQVVATQLEKVNPKMGKFLTQMESPFAQLFKKSATKHQVSAWNAASGAVLAFRIPVQLSVGGDYQVITLDGGDLGSGSLMDTAYMTIGYFSTDIAYQVPMLAAMATKANTQAITNVLQQSIGNAIKETALYNEIELFQDSTGIVAIANGTGSPTISSGSVTYNLDTTKSFTKLRGYGQLVDVYNSANVLQFSGARVGVIDFVNNAVTLTGVSTYTPHNTDQIAFPNMGTGSYTASTGSFRNGLYLFQTSTFSGSLLGLAYSSAYEMKTNLVNLGGGAYTPSAAWSGASQLVQRRDDSAIAKLIGVSHMSMRVSWYQQGVTIANQYLRPGESAKSLDLAGQGTDLKNKYDVADITHYVSRYADKTRVDWFDPSNYGYVQFGDIEFITTPEGQRIFIGHSSTTGNPTAGYQFYVANTRNIYTVDPGCSVYFYGGAIPSGQ